MPAGPSSSDSVLPAGVLRGGVLLLGADGMLGTAWRQALAASSIPALTPSPGEIDLTDPNLRDKLPEHGWATLVNCAAWTDVDGAETHEADATVVNGEGPGRLAAACRDLGRTLVHYSTDYLFNGRGTSPYPVDAPRDPINAYGRSKAAGESAIEAAGGDYLIVRTSWLYAPWGNNFVRTIARLVAEREQLRVVDDQRGRPTSAEGLVRTTAALLAAGVRGHAHATDAGECTWYEFASAIEEQTRAGRSPCHIEPCDSSEFPRPAKRPAYSVLDLSETERHAQLEHWRDALAGVLRAVKTEGSRA